MSNTWFLDINFEKLKSGKLTSPIIDMGVIKNDWFYLTFYSLLLKI